MGTGRVRKHGKTYWTDYYIDGRRRRINTHTANYQEALQFLKLRLGEAARGVPSSPKIGRLRFEEAMADVFNDYAANGKRSLDDLKRRSKLHLEPFFGGRRLAHITSSDVRAYITARQKEGAANASVNRELAALKRAFVLAVQAGKLVARPYIPMLREDNTRRGFFEREQFEAVRAHLPEDLRPVVAFVHATGWRATSEVLPLQWRQVDLDGGTVRLDAGTTKNGEARVFPLTAELRALLLAQRARTDAVQRERGRVVPHVFHRNGDRIRDFRGAWQTACKAAGVPGRIPHDFRRTAVRNLERAGVPRSIPMAMVGHKTEAVYRRYAIVAEADLHEAARRLDANATR